MALGLAIGLVCVLLRRPGIAPLVWFVKGFVEIIRDTPFMVQAFFLYLGLPSIGIRISPDVAAVLALGLRPLQIFRHIILIPALRACFPAFASQFILLMLTSSIVASIRRRRT